MIISNRDWMRINKVKRYVHFFLQDVTEHGYF